MEALAGTIAADADGHWRVASPSAIGAPLEAPQQQQQSAAVAAAREPLNILAAAAGPVLPPPAVLTGLWSPREPRGPTRLACPICALLASRTRASRLTRRVKRGPIGLSRRVSMVRTRSCRHS